VGGNIEKLTLVFASSFWPLSCLVVSDLAS